MSRNDPTTNSDTASKATAGDASTQFGIGSLIKETGSICPVCLDPLPARVLLRGGQVWMDKHCPDHGPFCALLASDARHYRLRNDATNGSKSCCGTSCGAPLDASATEAGPGSGWTNHSCNLLIEITERCNLSCPTCFAGSSPEHSKMMDLDEFTRQVDRLARNGKQGADVIQLSGGEPTIHPDLFRMIDVLIERGFQQVCINTNGIKLAQERFARRLADCVEGSDAMLYAYLQFDGFEDSTHALLRGRGGLLTIKNKALANCHRFGIRVHPVMTLTRDINDHEVGDFLNLALQYPHLNNVVIQPAMYSGRYENPQRKDRLTLADTVELICRQFGVFQPDDFTPIPCSDPNCFGMAVALRTAGGLLPVSRYFPRYENWGSAAASGLIDTFTDTINGPAALGEALRWAVSADSPNALDDEVVDQLLDALVENQNGRSNALWESLFVVSIKPFMDAWTYDQDRIDACCVHILDPDGNPVSFCEYNAVNRPRMDTGHATRGKDQLALEVVA